MDITLEFTGHEDAQQVAEKLAELVEAATYDGSFCRATVEERAWFTIKVPGGAEYQVSVVQSRQSYLPAPEGDEDADAE